MGQKFIDHNITSFFSNMKISSQHKNRTVKLGFQSIVICLAYAKLSKNAVICN